MKSHGINNTKAGISEFHKTLKAFEQQPVMLKSESSLPPSSQPQKILNGTIAQLSRIAIKHNQRLLALGCAGGSLTPGA